MLGLKSRVSHMNLMSVALAVLFGAMGCVVHVRPVGPPPPPAVVVTPGWYYDSEYYDEYGVFHPRAYWFYGDRGWEHRDYAPAGVAFRDRSVYVHLDRGHIHEGPHPDIHEDHRHRE